uniref:Uncharacterized protein n=1 Tax=Opuntia streptacantha TaxID=393608 RepID=A0A7C9EVX8_OPUST
MVAVAVALVAALAAVAVLAVVYLPACLLPQWHPLACHPNQIQASQTSSAVCLNPNAPQWRLLLHHQRSPYHFVLLLITDHQFSALLAKNGGNTHLPHSQPCLPQLFFRKLLRLVQLQVVVGHCFVDLGLCHPLHHHLGVWKICNGVERNWSQMLALFHQGSHSACLVVKVLG